MIGNSTTAARLLLNKFTDREGQETGVESGRTDIAVDCPTIPLRMNVSDFSVSVGWEEKQEF